MKMKDLSLIWMEGNNYAILSLPFITYSIQPNWNNKNNQNNFEKPFIASFKSSISMFQSFDCEYKTTSEAKKGCEIHLKKLLEFLFQRLDTIVDFGVKE